MSTKDVATLEHFNAVAVPANAPLDGFQGMTSEVFAVPFVRVVQKMSPVCDPAAAEYVEEAKPGMFFRTLPATVWPSPIKIIVAAFRSCYVGWLPNRGGYAGEYSSDVVARNVDAGSFACDEKGVYIPETGARLQQTYIYTCVNADHLWDGVFALTLSSTQLKAGKQFNFKLMNSRLPDGRLALPFFMVWRATTIPQKNEKGSWYGVQFEFERFVDKNELDFVVEARKALASYHIKLSEIDEEGGRRDIGPDEVPF